MRGVLVRSKMLAFEGIGLLWEELEEYRAKNSVSDQMGHAAGVETYFRQQTTAHDALLAGGGAVVSGDIPAGDFLRFTRALERGEWTEAEDCIHRHFDYVMVRGPRPKAVPEGYRFGGRLPLAHYASLTVAAMHQSLGHTAEALYAAVRPSESHRVWGRALCDPCACMALPFTVKIRATLKRQGFERCLAAARPSGWNALRARQRWILRQT